jgi:hypothetical protein
MSYSLYPGAWIGGILAATLIGVPILIHLINMMRHRRVEWAAMEFLLLSQKKNRTWVLLKQLLLLAMRMAAIAAVVFLVPHPKVPDQLGRWLGTSKTHHVILLDDSYSMSDRWGDTSAFDEAKGVVGRIGSEAAAQSTPQTLTLVRFSRPERADLKQEPVDKEFPQRLQELIRPMRPSETAAEPLPALAKSIAELLPESETDRCMVYVVSDFRVRQWGDPTDLKKRLQELTGAGTKLSLVNCVESARPNLAITDLAPAPGIRAAGVPMFMEVTVKNFGDAPLRDVPVELEEDGTPRPAVTIPHVPPRDAVKKRFQIHFPTAGEHQVVARLQSDAVTTDNSRYGVLDLPIGLPVLLIDGDPDALDARILNIALESQSNIRTGINPRIEQPRFLSLNPLNEFHAICLANVERLDKSSIQALENYIAEGGGVAMFLGPRSRGKFINDELYREGKGFFPMPVAGPTILRVDHLEKAPDLEVLDERHPVFRVLAGDRYKFLSMVTVEQYFAVPKGWAPASDSTVRVLAQLRGGAPLAVEKSFGKGRVIAFTTTAAPVWSNWAQNPSFVVGMLEMLAYLANQPAASASRQVGAPLELNLDPGRYQRQVRFVTPSEQTNPLATTDAVPKEDRLTASLAETDASGIYRVRLTRKDGSDEVRHFAYNVDTAEGDLRTMTQAELVGRLDPVPLKYFRADEYQYSVEDAGYDLFEMLMYLLILLLVGEQILAWSASYHPAAPQQAGGKGGAR